MSALEALAICARVNVTYSSAQLGEDSPISREFLSPTCQMAGQVCGAPLVSTH